MNHQDHMTQWISYTKPPLEAAQKVQNYFVSTLTYWPPYTLLHIGISHVMALYFHWSNLLLIWKQRLIVMIFISPICYAMHYEMNICSTCVKYDKLSWSISSVTWLWFLPYFQNGTHFTNCYELIIEILQKILCFNFDSKDPIMSQFCPCHDRWAVMTWAELRPDLVMIFHVRTTQIHTSFG